MKWVLLVLRMDGPAPARGLWPELESWPCYLDETSALKLVARQGGSIRRHIGWIADYIKDGKITHTLYFVAPRDRVAVLFSTNNDLGEVSL